MVSFYDSSLLVAGCDEAGRGCLAGPVVAAAVILPDSFDISQLDDSKKLSETKREQLRKKIINEALCYRVKFESPRAIEKINILQASIQAMRLAVQDLPLVPDTVLVDGNRFHPLEHIPHKCIVKGDSLYASISAASILAKTFRDDYMKYWHQDSRHYAWNKNKGYPTREHRQGIVKYGTHWLHRKTFRLTQPDLFSE